MRKSDTRFVVRWFLSATVAAAVVGCGDSDIAVPIGGNVVQGPVEGATVFADNLSAGVGTQGVLDEAEKPFSAVTNAQGTFTIADAPTYQYELISIGGVDKITNQPAITMRAEGGGAGEGVTTNVLTPLTTLVAATPPAEREAMKATIASLGVDYKAKIDERITPAAAALVKAVTTTATQVVAVLNKAAGGNSQEQKVSTAAAKAVQTELLAQLASNIKGKTAAELNDSTKIADVAKSAATAAVTRLVSGAASAAGLSFAGTVGTAAADAIAEQVKASVTDVVDAIAAGSGGALSSNAVDARPEEVVLSSALSAIADSTSEETTAAPVANVVVTPPVNQPPEIRGDASVSGLVEAPFSYRPDVEDRDSSDILTLSISGSKALPPGLTFNPATGVISGRPTAAGTGTYTIRVTDGIASASLSVTLTFSFVSGATGASF